MDQGEASRTHDRLNLAGFRALATAAGLLQITRELKAAGVLSSEAVDRIKESMLSELLESAPRTSRRPEYVQRLRKRLEALFEGNEGLNENIIVPIEGEEPR